MAVPVVIDMGIVEPPQALVVSMVEACEKAVGDGDCHLVREAPQGPYRAIAILTWDGPDKVRVEVGLRRDTGTEWRTRSLSFQPEDAELERFRSVGFVVGTLATQEETPGAPAKGAPPPPAAPAPKPQPTPPPAPPVPSSKPSKPVDHSLGLVATLGGALDEGAPRYGGALRGRIGLAPWVGLAMSAGGSFRPTDEHGLSLRFLDAGLGAAFVLAPWKPVGWELTLEAVVENFQAEADASGKSAAEARTLPAARAELDLVWAVAPPLELVAGGNVFARPASTTISVAGESAGSTGIIEVGLAAGARVRL
ncbi:MAG TPA: hypothetical protein VFZ53_25600 [Polyangiaceae bacterium]